MSGININHIHHGSPTVAFTGKSTDFNTLASLTEINCEGYNKLFVQYVITQVDSTWDRAGDIIVYGSLFQGGTYTAPDATLENATFSVTSTDDDLVGAGEWYVVENIMPFIKVGWDNTTAGTKGTITATVMPFNT